MPCGPKYKCERKTKIIKSPVNYMHIRICELIIILLNFVKC